MGEAQATGELTIEQLAAQTGMTVRNVRAWQSRGLLPRPTLRGRTGYYGADHVQRVGQIAQLQAEGFNLTAIQRLLDSGSAEDPELLWLYGAVLSPFETAAGQVVSERELRELWGELGAEDMERATDLGLLERRDDGSIAVRSPALLDAGRELARLGMPLHDVLQLAERVRTHAEGIAGVFVELFLEHVWKPFEQAGMPQERWPDVREALERLGPLASTSLLTLFNAAMSARVQVAFGEHVARRPRPVTAH